MTTTEIIASEPDPGGPGTDRRAPARRRRRRRCVVVVIVGALFDDAIVGFVADLAPRARLPCRAGWSPAWSLLGQVLGVVVIVGGRVVGWCSAVVVPAGVLAAAAGARCCVTAAAPPDSSTHVAPQVADARRVVHPGPARPHRLGRGPGDARRRRHRRRPVGRAPVAASGLGPRAHRAAHSTSSARRSSFDTLLAVLAGWAAGAAVIVALGAPSRRPTGASIAAGLAAVGRAAGTARAGQPRRPRLHALLRAPVADGSALFVKALGDDERSADLLFRVYRRLQPRDLGDEKAFSSLRRAVEHEALVALAARDLGVRTPRARGRSPRPSPTASCSPTRRSPAAPSTASSPSEVTDDVLAGVWEQLALLRSHRIAHRDLRLANVFLADDGDGVDHRLRLQRAGRVGPAPRHRPGRAARLLHHQGRRRPGRRRRRGRWVPTRPADGARAAAAPDAQRRHPHRDAGAWLAWRPSSSRIAQNAAHQLIDSGRARLPSGPLRRLNRRHRGGTPGGSVRWPTASRSRGGGVDAVEELSDLELPPGEVGVSASTLSWSASSWATWCVRRRPAGGRGGRRRRGRCGPGVAHGGDTRYCWPSWVRRFTGTRRGSLVV